MSAYLQGSGDSVPTRPEVEPALHSSACFHCGEPLLGSMLCTKVGGILRPMCCSGCQAVAELIASAGLSDFYRYRESASDRPDRKGFVDDSWRAYAQPEL